ATASAGFYSLIQCAKLAGFDPYAFLRELFKSWEMHPRTCLQGFTSIQRDWASLGAYKRSLISVNWNEQIIY
ncbi:hypothetical protein, partial [Leptospira weilii]|uniref:hypothetical protein n=1 Tax=Leptospira weilii TaxID=28184 RepID=UPI000AEB855E